MIKTLFIGTTFLLFIYIFYKIVFVFLLLLGVLIGSKLFKMDENKWDDFLKNKLKFKFIVIYLGAIFLLSIIFITILSKYTYEKLILYFNPNLSEKIYWILPTYLILKLIYKCIFKREEIEKIKEYFSYK